MARVPSFGRRLQSTALPPFSSVSWPATKVTEEDRSRCVNGRTAAAAHPIAAVIPGTISKGIPSRERCSASSPPRPNMSGSPDLRRTTDFPSRASRTIASWIALLQDRPVPGGSSAPCEADPGGLCGRQRENFRGDEVIVDDGVGAPQQPQRTDGEQVGVARPGAGDVDLPRLRRDPLPASPSLQADRDLLPVILEELPQCLRGPGVFPAGGDRGGESVSPDHGGEEDGALPV